MADLGITLLDSGGFVAQAWASEALSILRTSVVLTRLIARDSDYGAPGFKYQSITIPYAGLYASVTEKAEDTPVTPIVTSPSKVTVTLDHHAVVPIAIEDFAAAMSNADLARRFLEPAAEALATYVEAAIYTEAMSGVSQSSGTAGTPLDAAGIRAGVKVLNDAKTPQANRYLAVTPATHLSLLGDDDLKEYFAFARPEGISQGSLGSLYGADTYMSTAVPITPGTPDQENNLLFHRTALIIAFRGFPEIPASYGVQSGVAIDPESGLGLRVTLGYSQDLLAIRANLDVLFGVKTLRPDLATWLLA